MTYRLTLMSGEEFIFEAESHHEAREEAADLAEEHGEAILALECIEPDPKDEEMFYLIARLF